MKNYRNIARLLKITPERVVQIMNLVFVAPDMQEELLFLTAKAERKQPVSMSTIRRVVAEPEWRRQRALRLHA